MAKEQFLGRHVGPRPEDVEEMLKVIGVKSVDELIEQTVPASIRLQELLDLEDFDFSNLILDYGQITGDIELKKEILSLYEHGTIDNITTAQGCLQANELVMNTLLEKGDEVISGCSKITWLYSAFG